ncbi:cytochrome c [Sphingomonas sp.]|jgi:mono/diheme cytochrome c family protein|uniref:c-type cytochrome n=1 Tax=Sphingomonas sp. TaxID=28214 RepID=UPI002E2F07E4|nr:cytochrome c [Sphingomonas sp.]HEX4695205.1 cytochrome c [Sphingomonas sp.]
MTKPTIKMLAWGWLLGIASAALVGIVILVLVLTGVAFNTSATSADSQIFAAAIHATMTNSVKRRASGGAPRLPLDTATLLAGAREYETHCIACHGGPGVARAPWASAMLPTPPYLLDTPNRWSHAELYTIVHDGVKMTAMPAWGEVESDRQIAAIVAFLEVLPKMTTAQFDRVRQRARPPLLAR